MIRIPIHCSFLAVSILSGCLVPPSTSPIILRQNIQLTTEIKGRIDFVGCQVINNYSPQINPSLFVKLFTEGLGPNIRKNVGMISIPNVVKVPTELYGNGHLSGSNKIIVYDKTPSISKRSMSDVCLAFLRKYSPSDNYLVANIEFEQKIFNSSVLLKKTNPPIDVILIICIYDKEGNKVFSKNYLFCENDVPPFDKENTQQELILMFSSLILQNKKAINEDLSFLKDIVGSKVNNLDSGNIGTGI